MHRLIVILLIIIVSNQFSFGKDIISTKISSNHLSQQTLDDWQLDDSSGIPVWIAWKEERNKGFHFVIYIEPQNYSLDNLKKVFAALNKHNTNALYLLITAETSKNAVHDEVTARRTGYISREDMPDRLRSFEKEDLSATKGESYPAVYFRAKDTEGILYRNLKNGNMEMIDIRKNPSKRKL